MQWARNASVESFLGSLGVQYTWMPEMPYAKLNIKESLKNNARISTKPVLEELVFPYAQAMQSGATFPGIVTSKNGRGYHIHDGNNRMAAFEMADLAVPAAVVGAYVIDTDDEAKLALITRSLNRLNGGRQDLEEAIQQALAILDSNPSATHAEVGRIFGISQSTISHAVKAREVAAVLRERRIKCETLPRAVLSQLGKLRRHEPVMAVAADVAVTRKLSAGDVRELVDVALAQTSESRQIEAVNEYDKKFDVSRPVFRQGDRTKTSFLRFMHGLFGVVAKNPSMEHLHLTSKSEAEQVREDWLKLRKLLDKVLAE